MGGAPGLPKGAGGRWGVPNPANGGAATTGGKFGGGARFCGPEVNDRSGELRGGGGGATCRNGAARMAGGACGASCCGGAGFALAGGGLRGWRPSGVENTPVTSPMGAS